MASKRPNTVEQRPSLLAWAMAPLACLLVAATPPPPSPPTEPIVIAAVGDVMLGSTYPH